MAIAGFIWCWSQSINYVLFPNVITRTGTKSRVLYILTSPLTVTIFFIAVITFTIIAIISLGVSSNKLFNRLFELFKVIDGLLNQASLEVTNGLIPNTVTLDEQQVLFESVFEKYTDRWIRVWICWLVVDSLILIVSAFMSCPDLSALNLI